MSGTLMKRVRPVFKSHESNRLPLYLPEIWNKDDLGEIKRLMKRRAPPVGYENDSALDEVICTVCLSKDHESEDCLCLKEIPPGVVIGPGYDRVCLGCGRIGMACCSRGAYAVEKICDFCLGGHWFWEDRCETLRYIPGSVIDTVWLPLKKSFEEEQSRNNSRHGCWTCEFCGMENQKQEVENRNKQESVVVDQSEEGPQLEEKVDEPAVTRSMEKLTT